ncbi:Uncharacterized protein dnl_61900 [Desulfonema limicola]|uniref:Uncharacterized protein n=1 Tax=Desulfonema limicola TaxID=45656 RepID=A0A975GJR6_9BACT|nr:hypothetical protein [Desulfonema limicola]QTA83775.1 Uncharacterized protein dnl_61900 [Desulfonema limicola]
MDKIDPEFLNRINAMPPDQTIQVILILSDDNKHEQPKIRQTDQEREKIMTSVLKSGRKTVKEINSILQAYGGKKLTSSPNVLGCISIAATGPAIKALACLDKVKAVMEDHPVYLVDEQI